MHMWWFHIYIYVYTCTYLWISIYYCTSLIVYLAILFCSYRKKEREREREVEGQKACVHVCVGVGILLWVAHTHTHTHATTCTHVHWGATWWEAPTKGKQTPLLLLFRWPYGGNTFLQQQQIAANLPGQPANLSCIMFPGWATWLWWIFLSKMLTWCPQNFLTYCLMTLQRNS